MNAKSLPFFWIFCLLASLWTTSLSATAEVSARDLIISTTEQLVQGLQDRQDDIRQDISFAFALADETVIPHVDFELITQWVTGKYWRRASPDQRSKLVKEFRQLLTRSYVTAMVTYTDQILAHRNNVHYPPSGNRPGEKRTSVPMVIDLNNGQHATVEYLMHLANGGWKIFDVKVEGISLAITYRSTFAQEINRNGIDGLIATLEERNRRNEVLLAAP